MLSTHCTLGWLTSQSWILAGEQGWQWDLSPDSPQYCCCRNTLEDRIQMLNCMAEQKHCRCNLKKTRRAKSEPWFHFLCLLSSCCTWAGKVTFSQLCKVEAPQRGRRSALSVEAQRWPLPQPRRQPGQVTITAQGVGMKTTGGRQTGEQIQRKWVSGQAASHMSVSASSWWKELLTRCGALACGWNWRLGWYWCCCCSTCWEKQRRRHQETKWSNKVRPRRWVEKRKRWRKMKMEEDEEGMVCNRNYGTNKYVPLYTSETLKTAA